MSGIWLIPLFIWEPWLELYSRLDLARILSLLLVSYFLTDFFLIRIPLGARIRPSEMFLFSLIFLLPFDLRLGGLLVIILLAVKLLRIYMSNFLIRLGKVDLKTARAIGRSPLEEVTELISILYFFLIWYIYAYLDLGVLSDNIFLALNQFSLMTLLYIIFKGLEYYTEGLLRVLKEGFKLKTVIVPPFYHMLINTFTIPFLAFLSATFVRASTWAFLLFIAPLFPVFYSIFNYTRILIAAKDTIEKLADVVEGKTEELKGHSKKVASLAKELAKQMGLSFEEIELVEEAAKLQNIGYVVIREGTLGKNSSLNEEEWAEIKKHPEVGENILSNLKLFERIRLIVRSHHERWDGRGYPDKLRTYEIPVEARIIALADAFIAMRSKRPYRPPKSLREAVAEIIDNRGTQFDPKVVDAFINYLIGKGELSREEYSKIVEEVKVKRQRKATRERNPHPKGENLNLGEQS